jgi:hypothetical protein
MANHVIMPEIISGYELNQYQGEGYWSLISPEATTNLIINPSFERDDYGWLLPPIPNLELKFERSADISIFGAYSVRIVGKNVVPPDHSFIYMPLTEWQYNAPLTFSAYGITFMEATNGRALRVGIVLKVGGVIVADVTSQPLKGGGRWFRVHASIQIPDTFRAEDPNKSIELRLYHGGGKNEVVYWDAIQAEYKAYPTTYADGDMLGLTGDIKPYCWTGAPHRSSSIRSGATRSGGYPINFSEHGFRMLEFQGVGLPPIDVQTQAYGMLPGAIYNQSNYQQREMVLSGQVCGDKFQTLRQQVYAVERLLSPNVATRLGQFKVLFAQSDCCDDTLEIMAAYNGGMEGDYTSLYQSEFTVRALSADPFFKTIGERGQLLEYSSIITMRNIIQRYGNGQWDNLDGGVYNSGGVSGVSEVRKVLWINNKIVAFGNFDTANGVTLNKLAQYSDEAKTWIDIFDSVTYIDMTDLDVRDMVALPNGKLVFSAYDTGLQGTGVWTTNLTSLSDCQTTVTQLGSHWLTDPPKTWETLAVALNGNIFAAGSRGDIEFWDGTQWRVFMTGFNGTIHDMQFDVDGYLYAAGDFSYEFTVPADALPSVALKVLPKWKALKSYEVKAVPSQVVLNEGTLIAVADVTGDDADDPITTYAWTLVENSTGTPNPADSRVCKFALINGDTLFSTIRLTIMTTSGKVLSNDIVYYCDATADPTWTAVTVLATDNKLSYNLDAITFTPDVVTIQADDPITQYLWTNDQTAETSTDETHTFDFSTLIVGDEVVVTLQTSTAYGGVNINSVTLIKDVDKGMIEVADSATDNETNYIKVIPGQSATKLVICTNGVMIDPNRNVQCLGDLPPSYCLDIGADKRVYIGARDGLYSWNGEAIQRLASTQKITALKINPLTGEIYIGGGFGLLKWNFYYLVSAGIEFRAEAILNDFDFNECDAALAIGLRYHGAARTNGYTPLYYPGSAEVRPSFRFFGPGNIVEITNFTTYQSLYPQHTMQDGEIVDFSLEHGRVGFRSNYWGELPLSKGTNTNFFLAKGDNDFGMWIQNTSPTCTEAVAIFPVKHLSANALCVPGADVRFPIAPLPDECCNGRTLVVGDSPLASCYKAPCAVGSIIIDPMTRQVWINTQCNEPIDPCDECSPPQRRYIDDAPTPDVTYDCVPGTVVIDPITRGVYVLVDCGLNSLLDDNGDPINDSDDICIDDDGP